MLLLEDAATTMCARTPQPESSGGHDRIESILAQIEQLPTLPAVAMQLLKVTTSPDTHARDVVRIVESDQALTARILSLVRKANLGIRQDVTTIDRAVVLLGFEAVRNAVLSVQIFETFHALEGESSGELDPAEFWKHSLAVACASQLIGEVLGKRRVADEAYVCGLLHDIGKIALDVTMPKSYARVIQQVRSRYDCICDAEKDVIGVDHTVVGKRLLTKWKLPTQFIECAWLHHQGAGYLPGSLSAPELVRIVHLANLLVIRQRIGFSGYHSTEAVSQVAESLGLSKENIDFILQTLPERVETHCKLVGLDSLTSSSLYCEALSLANEELGRLNASLSDTNRQLSWRTKYFDGLANFWRNCRIEDGPIEVCRLAARCVASIIGVDQAVGFALSRSDHSIQVGIAGDAGVLGRSGMYMPSLPAPSEDVTYPSNPVIMPVPAALRPICELCESCFAKAEHWMLPLVHEGQAIGGVLLGVKEAEISSHSHCRDEMETLSGSLGMALNMSISRAHGERLHEELAEMNRQLQYAQQELLRTRSLQMIGQMAAGAAHELNNPLAVISGRAQLLARDLSDENHRKTMELINEQCRRATTIVSELMDFAKPYPAKPEPVGLQGFLEQLRNRWLNRSSLKPTQIHVQISDPHVRIQGDPEQLTTIFEALMTNAVEATADRKADIHINSASLSSDEKVVITVEDNGRGMTPDVLEHAIDPFFSYRPAGRGRGLGLSMAARLVEGNHGRLWLESTPEKGTTVFVELPAAVPRD